MNQQYNPQFQAGENIALKIPKYRFTETVAFYRDVLQLPYLGQRDTSHVFQFGAMRLWLDEVPNYSQVDIWLELKSNNLEAATSYLMKNSTPVRDELEPLGDFQGHWISDPAGIIYLLAESSKQQGFTT